MLPSYSVPRWINIGVHVLCGTGALALGLVAILSAKGGRLHIRSGRLFLYVYLGVIATALIGLFVFEFRSFLLVVTILSFYDVFAGYRALQLRGRRPALQDQIASVAGLLSPALFIAAMRYLHQPWNPILTWSILGGLLALSSYDLLRNWLPREWLKRVWVQEHLVKMMGAYIAITTAAAGTIFPQYLPWIAIGPSIVGEAVAIGFILVGPRAWRRSVRPTSDLASRPPVAPSVAVSG